MISGPFKQQRANYRNPFRSRRNGEKRFGVKVKMKFCILISLSPGAQGHLRDHRVNYPEAPAAHRIRRTRGEDEKS